MSGLRFEGVKVAAVSHVLPPRVVSSEEIEERLAPVYERLRLPFGRLEMMTGIRERRFWEPGTAPSHGSILAGSKALEAAGIAPDEIGCLIHASVSRDFLEPATASVVHHALRLPPSAAIFDLSNACLGVQNSMVVLANMIGAGQIRAGLVVAGETAEGLHEATVERVLADREMDRAAFKGHFASLTIGSGAAAVLLTDSSLRPDAPELLGGAVWTDSDANELCREDLGGGRSDLGPLMATDSEALLNAGIELARKTWLRTLEALGWNHGTPDHLFTHQIGRVHRSRLYERLELDPTKDHPTLETLGNTGAVALPAAFSIGVERGLLASGDRVALLGMGSGLSSVMLGVAW